MHAWACLRVSCSVTGMDSVTVNLYLTDMEGLDQGVELDGQERRLLETG
jgi:hypothetical protein